MKKAHISDIALKLNVLPTATVIHDDEITRITSTLENAGPHDLVVYNLKENDEKASITFRERFLNSKCNNFILPYDFNFPRAVNKIIAKSFFEDKNYIGICDLVFGSLHQSSLKIVAITGTNGKSSTVFFLNQLVNLMGIRAASLGTIGLYIGTTKIRDSLLTTPDYFELRETLSSLVDHKIEYLFLEASSHALLQDRFLDLRFQGAGWTNLTHDHLDYHGNLSNYFDAKLKILRNLNDSGKLIISLDSPELFHKIQEAAGDYSDRILFSSKLELVQEIPSFLRVEFNYNNLCLAISILDALGIKFNKELLGQLQPPPGRFSVQRLEGLGDVIVDYAHTPDGLEKVLSETRKLYRGQRLIVIFGCGGNRDKTKRSIMGAVANKYCDEIVVTNDNPRFEEPMSIASDISSAITAKHSIILDRQLAICETILAMKSSDVIVIAGKGHESYQEIKGKRLHFNDEELLESISTLQMIKKLPSFIRSDGLPSFRIQGGICSDSRVISSEQVFLALVGENFDGANYIASCFAKGVRSFILNHSSYNESITKNLTLQNPNLQFIFVTDTDIFLAEFAKEYLQRIRINRKMIVIGITGSNGKTTTKDMLFHLLDSTRSGRVHKTQGNLNNHIGLPLTILSIKDQHDVVILEMGTNHPGEIDYLCNIAMPDAGIITCVGDSHLEFFENRAGVLKEKRVLYDYIMKTSLALFVTNGDDSLLATLPATKTTYFVGKENGNIKISPRSYNQVTIHDTNNSTILQNDHLIGAHNFHDLALAFALSIKLYPDNTATFTQAVQTFRTHNNRSEVRIENSRFIFLDAYNANPSSMESSLTSFIEYVLLKGHKLSECLFVIGDMNELGDQTEVGHIRIGELLRKHLITNVVFIGRYSDFYLKGFGTKCTGTFRTFRNTEECQKHLPQLLQGMACVFVKGSRSIKLEFLFPNSK